LKWVLKGAALKGRGFKPRRSDKQNK